MLTTFDHFPVVLTLSEYDWSNQMSGCSMKRPLIVNNLLLNKPMFRSYVQSALSYANALHGTASDRWVIFTDCMQNVIRVCGKHYALQSRKQRDVCQSKLCMLRTQGNLGTLSDQDEQEMADCVGQLNVMDLEEARKARFLSRCSELKDTDCMSKGFFKRLASKRSREALAKIELDDGSIIQDGISIAQKCTQYFGQILSTVPITDQISSKASSAMLQYVDSCIDNTTSKRLEGPFEKEEIHYALQHLGNEKTPGLDGLSKEFIMAFWEELSEVIMVIINEIWLNQYMNPVLKKGLIKLLPKQAFCTKLSHWRPITMMGIIYKILAKAVALRLAPFLRKFLHASQSGFVGGRSIYDNILAVQLGIEHAQNTDQEMILLQLDYAKAFDSIRWDFIHSILKKMGFGTRIANIIFLLAANSESCINLNGRLTDYIKVNRSLKQGCPLSPLLFAVATHPLFCMLEQLSNSGKLHGLRIQNKNMLGLGFADDTLLFLKACNVNVANCLTSLHMYSDAAGLQLNIAKSTLINISAADFASINWHGKRLDTGHVFRYLGYPLGINVSNKQLITWVMERVRAKVDYWKCDEWPLHVRLRIVQAILIPYFLYFIPLLDWKETHIGHINSMLIAFLWGSTKGKHAFPLIRWDIVSQPKDQGGLGVLNLSCHMHARRATFLKHMFESKLQWTWILWEMLQYSKVVFHGNWELNVWDKLFSHAPVKLKGKVSACLVHSWKKGCAELIWNGRVRYLGNSLSAENVHWSFLFCKPPALSLGAKSRTMFNKGITQISHVLDSKGIFLSFAVAKSRFQLGIPFRRAWHVLCCFVFKLQIPLTQNLQDRFRDWALPASSKNWWTAQTKDFYSMLRVTVDIKVKGDRFWNTNRESEWWKQRMSQNWAQKLNLKGRLFCWRLLLGALPLTTVMQNRGKGFTDGLCPRCKKFKETARHAFWYCSDIREWWHQLRQIVFVHTGYRIKQFQFTFGLLKTASTEHTWLFTHLRFWFFWMIWTARNEALHNNINLFPTGLPWVKLKLKLMEDAHSHPSTSLRNKLIRVLSTM